jgi:hypothetical protein
MRRTPLLLLAVAPLLAACASAAAPPAPDEMRLDPMDATPKTMQEPSILSKAGETLLAIPENAVWWPYKIVSGGLKGAYDGIAGGMNDAPMPILGVVASPVTGAMGLVKGVANGAAMGPYLIKDSAQFGRALDQPWR